MFIRLDSLEPQGSAKGCQWFRDAKMRKGRNVLLEFLNFYVPIKIRVATLDTNHSVTDCTQKINCCFNPEPTWFCSQVSQHILP